MRLDATPAPASRALPLTWRRIAIRAAARTAVTRRAVSAAAASVLTLAVFAVYLTTLAPTVMWYDMGEFATVSATLGIAHNTGYPLLILLGKAFTFLPVGDTAYRVNLMSAVFTALAVGVVFRLIDDLTGDLVAAAFGAALLAFSGTVWANATWATSYGLNLFFTAVVLRAMFAWHRRRQPRDLITAALAFGLGMCNHRLIVLAAPPALLLLALGWRTLDRRTAALAALAFIAGLAVYLYLPIRGEQEPALSWARPATWHTYWSMFLNGQTPSGAWRIDLADRIDVLWAYPSYDLTWAGLALAAAGAAIATRRMPAIAASLAVVVILDAVIVETYSIHNVYNYLTPGYLALCVFAGIAASWLVATARRAAAARIDAHPSLVVAAVAAGLALAPAALVARNYQRVDRSGDYSARDFATTTLDRLPDNAVVLTDSWSASPLWYEQFVGHRRLDVLVSPIFSVPGDDPAAFARQRIAEGRPVYVAEGLRVNTAALEQAPGSPPFTLRPVLLDGIERMIVDTLPKPRYRDTLVSTGSLYALLPDPPVAPSPIIPASAARNDAFDAGVTLAGFSLDHATVARGDVAFLTYDWRADHPLAADLTAVTLFFDASGAAPTHDGMPVWSQTRALASAAGDRTSSWAPGAIIEESYYTLVPRSIAPGTYDIRVAVFDANNPTAARAASSHLTTIARITVK